MFKKVSIIGVGLIGGSLGGSLKERKLAEKITGAGRTEENLKIAKQRGLIDDYFLEPSEAVENAEIIVLGTPVTYFPEIVNKIKENLVAGQILTDVGSVKTKVIKEIEPLLPEGVDFVPSHPIAGTEKSGAKYAFSDLFEGKKCIITPGKQCSAESKQKIRKMWEGVGMDVAEMDAEKHDQMLALISHLPHMIAYSLVNCIDEKSREITELLDFTAGGFKDFTRIAESPFEMWRDICLWNYQNIVQAIEFYEKFLKELKEAVKDKNKEKLEQIFKRAGKVKKGSG